MRNGVIEFLHKFHWRLLRKILGDAFSNRRISHASHLTNLRHLDELCFVGLAGHRFHKRRRQLDLTPHIPIGRRELGMLHIGREAHVPASLLLLQFSKVYHRDKITGFERAEFSGGAPVDLGFATDALDIRQLHAVLVVFVYAGIVHEQIVDGAGTGVHESLASYGHGVRGTRGRGGYPGRTVLHVGAGLPNVHAILVHNVLPKLFLA
mmetsp:Transcript_65339/g.76766  ORF Transcript_65339/g.76766 Transcript_65339/m.76766 type:complete len:208 (-) Transcript_65339:798-1421(-)